MSLRSALTWMLTAALAGLAVLFANLEGFTLELGPRSIAVLLVLVGGNLGLMLIAQRVPRYARFEIPCHCLAQFSACAIAALIAQFPAVGLELPLVDGALARLDAAIGLAWPTQYAWAVAHPTVYAAMDFVYKLLLPQIPVVCFIVGYHDPDRLRVFTLANAFGLTATLALFALFPAASTFTRAGVTDIADFAVQFDAVREHGLRVLDPMRLTGLISFPSYHALLAVLVACAFARIPKLFPVALALEIAIIAFSPLIGGHYIADILAGSAMGLIAFYAAARIGAPRRAAEPAVRSEIATAA
ncbi:MAG TPA: phosphatase PAP2 family protein [Stellaceae bacterium]|nr:phosphatase PAP2 family protein [Stellaceae bacterium]